VGLNLDLIFGSYGFTIEGGVCNTPSGSCNLNEVPVFQWFHRQEHRAFDDVNANGVGRQRGPDALETGFNLRWRDGTIYQGNVSDGAGAFAFDQVFPFFPGWWPRWTSSATRPPASPWWWTTAVRFRLGSGRRR
jgi:large repetitive protein